MEQEANGFVCSLCEFSCRSKIGLGQHERHKHPGLRNEKRREQNKNRGQKANKGGRKNYVWSDEATELLKEMNDKFGHENDPWDKIVSGLRDKGIEKTKRQVQDKLRRLLQAEARGEEAEASRRRDTIAQNGPSRNRTISVNSDSSDDVFYDAIEVSHELQVVTHRENQRSIVVIEDEIQSESLEVMSTISQGNQLERRPVGFEEANFPHDQSVEVLEEVSLEATNEKEEWIQIMKNYVESREIDVRNKYGQCADSLRSEWINRRDNQEEFKRYINDLIEMEIVPLLRNIESEPGGNRVKNKNGSGRRGGNRGGSRRPLNHRERTKQAYARCQELFNNCPKKLAEYTVKGDFSFTESRQELPKTESIEEVYGDLWGRSGPMQIELPEQDVAQLGLCPTVKPITLKDIKKRISVTKSDSAAGVDGIKKVHIARAGVGELLEVLYNIVLLEGIYPDSWKVNRTTLIPKAGKDLSDIKNWRPITVGSIVARIYSALVDGKLRQFVKQSNRQKGFTSEDGCRQNIIILEQVMDEMKWGDGGVVSVLDVSKAFDSVPHSILRPALRRKGIPDHMIEMIVSMYDNCRTIIKGTDGAVNITLKRGVKQGDPLSPIIFNLAIEPLLDKLCAETRGAKIGQSHVPVLAFADDLVLLSLNRDEAQKQLNIVQKYFCGLGMALAASKCQAFSIMRGHKTWYMNEPNLNVAGVPVPNVGTEEVVTYLGGKVSPWVSLIKGQEVVNITKVMMNVKRLKLKPQQKLELLRTYILPRFVYRLTVNCPGSGVLQMVDSVVRQGVKNILHLPLSTARGFFYTPANRGGLGIMKFERVIQMAALKTRVKIKNSKDDVMKAVSERAKLNKYFDQCADRLRVTHPQSLEDCDMLKQQLKKRDTDDWGRLKMQGHGVQAFRNDKVGNQWLSNRTLISGPSYLTALKLRTNTFGTKVVMAQVNKGAPVLCRRCNAQVETLGHILGICVYTKPARINRHNEIRDFIVDKVSKRYPVLMESTQEVNGGLKRPDLIILKPGGTVIADVTVVYEKGNYIKSAARRKEEKYGPLAEKLTREANDASRAKVSAIVVGCRGAMPNKTAAALTELGLTKSDLLTIAMIALRTSIKIATGFMEHDHEVV